ncbi:MAG: hypothetical protein SF029_01480 [bacterium]|nr:hypothetical protein [bacterium]
MQKKWMLGLMVVALALLALVMPLAAHEGREVGDYSLTFGWRSEPAYAGMMNGPEVFIEPAHDHSEAEAT